MPVSSNRKKKFKPLKNQHRPNSLEVKKTQSVNTHSVQQSYYQGIVPSPEMMEKYKSVDNDLPNRLVKLTEDEAIHRRGIEKKITTFHFVSQIIGQIFALAAVCIVCYLSFTFMKNGNANEGKVIAVTVIVGLATAFLGLKVFKKASNEDNS